MISSNSDSWSDAKSGTPASRLSSAVEIAATWRAKGLLPSRNRHKASYCGSNSGWMGIIHHLAGHVGGWLWLRLVVDHPRPTAEPNAAGIRKNAKGVLKGANRKVQVSFL